MKQWMQWSVLILVFTVPAKAQDIVGSENCSSCHDDEYSVWEQSHHANSVNFSEHEDAAKIAKAMEITDLDEENACWGCHVVSVKADDYTEGVSCESCHGAASEWRTLHSCFGGQSLEECQQLLDSESDINKSQETAEHRTWRLQARVKSGMLPPGNLVALASNCLSCHTTPNESLVNKAGHTAGSDFELVSWTQGEVRHNFLQGDVNQPASIERKRVMYVVGRALDLELSLRALAKSRQDGKYAQAMTSRIKHAEKCLQEIISAHSIAPIQSMLKRIAKAPLAPNQAITLNAIADQIRTLNITFVTEFEPKAASLSKLDAIIPTKMKGDVP